ncbi:MAG: T9SS type A sorting domain-containing protein, partial [Candidatus Cloacimonetes bacterium]|nr:T9SS type A sorting domain-containing protein [Candidatus Cloacimonadota bacterium]
SVLVNNYPNPFNPTTTIRFSITQSSKVELTIYDVKGRLVETLVNDDVLPSTYTHTWNAQNIPSGTYFYQLKVNDHVVDTKSMILVK